jgi:hypothetical protein
MQQIPNRLILSFLSLLLGTIARGQNLTAKELILIHNNADFAAITTTLGDKGFKLEDKQTDKSTNVTTARWYFQPLPHPGEEVSSFLIKSVDNMQKGKTQFFLYNPFNYRDFINSLKREGYKFEEFKVIDNTCYYIFKNKKALFLTAERQEKGSPPYFEILLGTE